MQYKTSNNTHKTRKEKFRETYVIQHGINKTRKIQQNVGVFGAGLEALRRPPS